MGSSAMPSAVSAAGTATIHIESFAFTGPDCVPAGSEVTVMNMDTEAHTWQAHVARAESIKSRIREGLA
ncbi:hypothetical protein [Arthrobacter bambusae]|uniref:hypothetical protein n=1 Tax=Arthrobacter bambusae TaxID=1338426 RepID=UPI00278721CA|nr:hypothetical protein [Arthrobacter bambusae]MDQ0210328.1 nicotinic acid phosphoribosyltransferase [Arthrobacter bambusae]MDQ0234777.1 nicotinic acid phosphoribosyltransferase [Arthrobacter bambusae]